MFFILWDKSEGVHVKNIFTIGKQSLSTVLLPVLFYFIFVILLIYDIQKSETHWFRELYTIKILFEKLT